MSIPYGRQWITEEDIAAVVEVLRSDWLTQGPKVTEFEEALASYFGVRYAVTCSSGTAGLHLACLAAGIGPGDTVLTSPITFVASANCALYVGARPDFVDVDPRTACMDARSLEDRLSAGPVRAVIPVHFAGHPCDMVRISAAAREHGTMVIEDACHAWGASYQDGVGERQRVGACAHSDMAVFSSHPVKHLCTGEGGVITTNDRNLYDRLVLLRSHGITRDPQLMLGLGDPGPEDGAFYYEMQELGYNYRLTDIQCALGLSQLSRLDSFVERRRDIAMRYDSAFADVSCIEIPAEADGCRASYHIYVARIAGGVARRRRMFEALRAAGLGVNVHYIPVHLQPYYRNRFGFMPGDFPVAESFYRQAMTLPLYPMMSDEQVDEVIAKVTKVAGAHADD